MTARYHIASPDVAEAVKATEPCPECWPDGADGKRRPHLNAAGNRAPCPTCDDRNDTRSPLVGGWLTLPFPVQPGDELRMVEEQRRHQRGGQGCESASEAYPTERRQAHFATVTAGEVIPPEQSYGKWKGWAFVVASVVLHDPPKLTMPCPCCHEDPDEPQAGCRCESCKGGSVPLSVTDGQEVTA